MPSLCSYVILQLALLMDYLSGKNDFEFMWQQLDGSISQGGTLVAGY